MPTSCNTHDYDGKLRQKWFEMRSMLLEKYLANCLSFDDTIKEMEQWLDKKYFNVKRIGRARRSIKILMSHRSGNFDSRNDIDVEELLPILWNKVKNQDDIHDTFYEQLCDITGGSCSQGRSTRLFQFLFLFDLSSDTTTTSLSKSEDTDITVSNEQGEMPESLSSNSYILDATLKTEQETIKISSEQGTIEIHDSSATPNTALKTVEDSIEGLGEQNLIAHNLAKVTFDQNSDSVSKYKQQIQGKSKSNEEKLNAEEDKQSPSDG